MSLFGKILALLNIFGAMGLVYVAMLDYGKRQALAHSYFRHELVFRGLPVNDKEVDPENQPIVDKFAEGPPQELFGQVGGNPIRTQVEEVQRLKSIVDGKISSTQTKAQQAYVLAKILLPLVDNPLERDQILACRAYFASDQTTNALLARCKAALADALTPVFADVKPEPALHDSFRLAFRAKGGPAAEYFSTLIVAKLPDERAKAASVKMETEFEAAVEQQRVSLEKRYNQLFGEALGTIAGEASNSPSSVAAQKAAIARLMFGIAPFLAQEEILADPSKAKMPASPVDSASYQTTLVETDGYKQQVKRTYVVCGLKASVEAISERAMTLRRLGTYVEQSTAAERQQFLFDHAAILDQLREYSTVVREEQSRIAENQKKLSEYDQVVRLRKKEVEDLKTDLNTSRTQTEEEVTRLRMLSEAVLEIRVRVRDAIRDIERGEKRIRELEKQVRDLEK